MNINIFIYIFIYIWIYIKIYSYIYINSFQSTENVMHVSFSYIFCKLFSLIYCSKFKVHSRKITLRKLFNFLNFQRFFSHVILMYSDLSFFPTYNEIFKSNLFITWNCDRNILKALFLLTRIRKLISKSQLHCFNRLISSSSSVAVIFSVPGCTYGLTLYALVWRICHVLLKFRF